MNLDIDRDPESIRLDLAQQTLAAGLLATLKGTVTDAAQVNLRDVLTYLVGVDCDHTARAFTAALRARNAEAAQFDARAIPALAVAHPLRPRVPLTWSEIQESLGTIRRLAAEEKLFNGQFAASHDDVRLAQSDSIFPPAKHRPSLEEIAHQLVGGLTTLNKLLQTATAVPGTPEALRHADSVRELYEHIKRIAVGFPTIRCWAVVKSSGVATRGTVWCGCLTEAQGVAMHSALEAYFNARARTKGWSLDVWTLVPDTDVDIHDVLAHDLVPETYLKHLTAALSH